MDDNEIGNSSMMLFHNVKISKFVKFARPGGTSAKRDKILF